MSFAQHLTTQESADREPLFDDDDNASLQLSYYSLSRVPSRQRRTSISYDPLPETVEHEEKKIQPVAAYEVPPGKRLGKSRMPIARTHVLMCNRSPGRSRGSLLHSRVGHCFWLCGSEDNSD